MEMMRKEMDCHHPDDEPTDFVDPQTFSCNVTMALTSFYFSFYGEALPFWEKCT